MTISTDFERHMYEADIKRVRPRPVQGRRDCVADPDCQRIVVTRGMCRRHSTKASR